jgi:hypothetical protein
MLECDHSLGRPALFEFLPSEGEAANALDEISNLLRCGCVEEIKDINWSPSTGLSAYVSLKEPVQVYPLSNECNHTGTSEEPDSGDS